MQCEDRYGITTDVVPWLLMSGVVSLISASAGLASVFSERAWERFAAATAIFFTLGQSYLIKQSQVLLVLLLRLEVYAVDLFHGKII